MSAIQALSAEITSIENVIAGFAESFTSKKITASQQLCIGSTCVDEVQLQGLLSGQPQVQFSDPTPPTIAGTSTPPTIIINGDNPAIIHVGDSYADLGATITGPQADLNLGVKTFLNGTLVSNIVIDTSAVATDTIDYVATDSAGNTSTSTRTVMIEPVAVPSTTSPSGIDTASSTGATTTTPPVSATGTAATPTTQ